MKEILYRKYADAPAVGALPLSNWGGLEILDLDINEEAIVACFNFGNGREMIRRHRIIYTSAGRAYIRKAGRRYYLDNIMRTAL